MLFTDKTKCSRSNCQEQTDIKSDQFGYLESYCSWLCEFVATPIRFILELIFSVIFIGLLGLLLILGFTGLISVNLSLTHVLLIFIIFLLIAKRNDD